ncbi:MAG: hypothetical protein EP349_10390 [Alphaproteobacteria bacterium]|nr:MAG: hypothetical protein EP349_10390 [Alphaproteobacteria bacterium]
MAKKKGELKGNGIDKLLHKKISDLTEEDVDKLEVALGTNARPYPMWGTVVVDEDGHQSIEQRLGKIKDDEEPLRLYSERPYEEVIGMMYRDMPTPSMMPMLKDILEMIKPESKSRIYFMKGDPGAGKSFLGGLVGRAQSTRPVEIFDCGGKNMNDLLFEMVLDFGAGDALPEAIDKRLAAGALQPLSYGLLKSGLPSKFVEESDDGKLVIDWEGLKESGTENVEKAFAVLTKVSKLEGLDSAGGNALGMNSQYGLAIRDFIEGNFSTYDEYNKSKEGTDNALQTFLQFANGEIDECTVVNPLKNKDQTSGPSEFTFRREDTKVGWGIVMTGNAVEDGTTTRSLNKSVYSRLSPVTIPKPSLMDWQHRICQIMTGLPVSTLYNSFKDKADKDPEQFTEMLLYWREAGLTEEQKANVPQIHTSLLKNWKNVVEASEKLAKFYKGWAELTDPDKALIKDGNLVEEVDEEYQKEVSIDFRKVIQHLQYAMPLRARMTKSESNEDVDFDPKSWAEKPAKRVKRTKESVERNYGTRLTDLLADKIYETSGAAGKPVLYKHLKELMKQCGLKDLHLQEGAHSNVKSVEASLNINLFATTDPKEQMKLAQKMFADYVRESNADVKTQDDNAIVTVAQIKETLDRVKTQLSSDDASFVIPNTDVETLSSQPFITAEKVDVANEANRDFEPVTEELVDHDALMMTLAFPKASEQNLKAVWDKENHLALLLMKSNYAQKRIDLESDIEELKAQQPSASADNDEDASGFFAGGDDDLVGKQKELLDLLKKEQAQLKDFGQPTDEVDTYIKSLKQDITAAGGTVEDDTRTVTPFTGDMILDDDVKIAENNSDTGIGATTVVVKATNENGESERVPVHIIVNNNSQKTLVVGGETSERLSTLFREVGVKHVNRNDKNAASQLREALDDILRGASEETRNNVRSALLFRNDPVGVPESKIIEHNEKASMEDILLSYEPYLGKYLVAKQAPRSI